MGVLKAGDEQTARQVDDSGPRTGQVGDLRAADRHDPAIRDRNVGRPGASADLVRRTQTPPPVKMRSAAAHGLSELGDRDAQDADRLLRATLPSLASPWPRSPARCREPLDHLAEDRVAGRGQLGVGVHDEELAAVAVRVARAGHRNGPGGIVAVRRSVLQAVAVARAAGAGARSGRRTAGRRCRCATSRWHGQSLSKNLCCDKKMNDATVCGAALPSRSITIVPQLVLSVARQVAFCASDLLGGFANCCGCSEAPAAGGSGVAAGSAVGRRRVVEVARRGVTEWDRRGASVSSVSRLGRAGRAPEVLDELPTSRPMAAKPTTTTRPRRRHDQA